MRSHMYLCILPHVYWMKWENLEHTTEVVICQGVKVIEYHAWKLRAGELLIHALKNSERKGPEFEENTVWENLEDERNLRL